MLLMIHSDDSLQATDLSGPISKMWEASAWKKAEH